MTATQILNDLFNRKGQHVKVTWMREAKTIGNAPGFVYKRTSAYIRSGIEFANLQVVKDGIEAGERGPVQDLAWGNWVRYPFIIEHKGNEYIRLYPSSFSNLKPEVEWLMNNKPTTYQRIEPYLHASEKRIKPICFVVKAESIVAIED